jgi:hypothetical protein
VNSHQNNNNNNSYSNQHNNVNYNNNNNSNNVVLKKNEKINSFVPYKHPVACTLVLSTIKNNNNNNNNSNIKIDASYKNIFVSNNIDNNNKNISILDPVNNFDFNNDGFDAKQIREAFLRFFVSILIDYEDFLIFKSTSHSNVNLNNSNNLNVFRDNFFNFESFLNHQNNDPFVKQL